MTVRELVDTLNEYPSDMEVYIEIPKQKAYVPQYELSVRKGLYVDWSKHKFVVILTRGKQVK